MASNTERTIVNAAGLVQGIVLVTFPAASTIFTEKSEYGLSSTQYGDMFLPQVALAIAASLLGAGLARRISTKRVYLLGLACSTVDRIGRPHQKPRPTKIATRTGASAVPSPSSALSVSTERSTLSG